MFPIGHLMKSEVRDIAKKAWLPNASRKDSQWLCFIGKVNFSEFLKSHIPSKKGNIVDTSWKILGEHDGAFQYTIGQRKGIAVWGGPALFVIEKDVVNNTLIVWREDDARLFKKSCTLTHMNWLADVSFPFDCEAQIRYRQKAQSCTVIRENSKQKTENTEDLHLFPHEKAGVVSEFWTIEVIFDKPQRAISPGQVCTLYDGDRVLGSGIIGY